MVCLEMGLIQLNVYFYMLINIATSPLLNTHIIITYWPLKRKCLRTLQRFSHISLKHQDLRVCSPTHCTVLIVPLCCGQSLLPTWNNLTDMSQQTDITEPLLLGTTQKITLECVRSHSTRMKNTPLWQDFSESGIYPNTLYRLGK